jgi:flagellar biosynthesis protein FliP
MPFEEALAAAEAPIRGFMLAQTREEDISMFMEISHAAKLNSKVPNPCPSLRSCLPS